jgi:hypothetical protein
MIHRTEFRVLVENLIAHTGSESRRFGSSGMPTGIIPAGDAPLAISRRFPYD